MTSGFRTDIDATPRKSVDPVSQRLTPSRCIMSIHWSIWRRTLSRISFSPVTLYAISIAQIRYFLFQRFQRHVQPKAGSSMMIFRVSGVNATRSLSV